MAISKRKQAFALYDQGFVPGSDEVKAVPGLKANTRWTYYTQWRKIKGIKTVGQGAKPDGTTAVAASAGESVRVIAEKVPPKPPPPPPPENGDTPEADKKEDEEEEDGFPSLDGGPGAATGEAEKTAAVTEKVGKGGEPQYKSVAGQGLLVQVKISVKTMMLYEIAASMTKNGPLLLGDFIDTCVEDTYRGRGKDLGLVEIQEVKGG